MSRKLAYCLLVIFSLPLASLVTADDASEKPKPKYTIKEVMKNVNKKGLLKKVTSGEASQEEKVMLLDNYISLIENTPKKGDANSWQKLSGSAALAAGKVVAGRDGAIEELKVASNCKACHSVHK
ncbi:MAG: hypothetical protein GY768_15345 [Planctomycetaceae bacterium]|nr:hypothetical protein [Planctomycetaceae bacterium]